MTNVQVSVYRDANTIASEINLIKEKTHKILIQSSIEIGERLKEAKELVPHGKWGEWLQESVNYSQRTAQNLIKIADEMGQMQLANPNPQALAHLTYTQAVAILRLDSEERENFLEENDVENMSTRELEEAIKEKNEMIKQRDTLQARVKDVISEKTSLENQLKTSDEELHKRMQEVKDLEKKVLDAEKALKTTKSKANDKGTSEELDAAKKATNQVKSDLEASIKELAKLQEDLKKSEAETEKARKALDKKPKEVKVEVVPDDVQNRLIELEKNVKIAEHRAKFKASFEVIIDLFEDMIETVDDISKVDQDEYVKYSRAMDNLIAKLGERRGEAC